MDVTQGYLWDAINDALGYDGKEAFRSNMPSALREATISLVIKRRHLWIYV